MPPGSGSYHCYQPQRRDVEAELKFKWEERPSSPVNFLCHILVKEGNNSPNISLSFSVKI
jgi:hypothetical protein